MCTLTWWQEDPRYALFFNRDELKTRLPASPPETRDQHGVRFITPVDGNRGGTWLLANEFGLTIALLNHYPAQADAASLPEVSPSRGQLVLSLAHAPTVDAVNSSLAETSLDEFWPFHIFALTPHESPRLWTWSGPGSQLRLENQPSPPITTSSFRSEDVCRHRRDQYNSPFDQPDPLAALNDFHHYVDPGDGAFSVRMRRPNAQTVSFSRIDVDNDTIRFSYRPESPDSLDLNDTVTVRIPRHDPP